MNSRMWTSSETETSHRKGHNVNSPKNICETSAEYQRYSLVELFQATVYAALNMTTILTMFLAALWPNLPVGYSWQVFVLKVEVLVFCLHSAIWTIGSPEINHKNTQSLFFYIGSYPNQKYLRSGEMKKRFKYPGWKFLEKRIQIARVIPKALRLCKGLLWVHCSVPRAGGLKEGQREQVLSGLASFYVMYITALFLEKSLRDCSTGATKHFVTVVFLFELLLSPLLCYLFTFPLSFSSSTFLHSTTTTFIFHVAFYYLPFCPMLLSPLLSSLKTFLTSALKQWWALRVWLPL